MKGVLLSTPIKFTEIIEKDIFSTYHMVCLTLSWPKLPGHLCKGVNVYYVTHKIPLAFLIWNLKTSLYEYIGLPCQKLSKHVADLFLYYYDIKKIYHLLIRLIF